MGDVAMIVKRLGLAEKSQMVTTKAAEYYRLASARLGPRGLGNVRIVANFPFTCLIRNVMI